MVLIGQTVPDGNASLGGKLLDDRLVRTTVLDTVIHTAEHAGGILDGLFLAHLRRAGVEVGHAHSEIAPGNLKGAAGAGGGLFKEQYYVFAVKVLMRHPGSLHALEVL